MNAHAYLYESDHGTPETDFSWDDLTGDHLTAGGTGHIGAAPGGSNTFPTDGRSAKALSGCPALREWLLCGGYDTVRLPLFAGAAFEDYRDLALRVLSLLPTAELIFAEGSDARAVALFGSAEGFEDAPADSAEPTPRRKADPKLEELGTCLSLLRQPEASGRVEARLAHLAKTAATPLTPAQSQIAAMAGHSDEAMLLREGAMAANAMIPAAGGGLGAGLHLGFGYVLSHWTGGRPPAQGVVSPALRYHLGQVPSACGHAPLASCDLPGTDAPGSGRVPIDPTPGKVLKHEHVHALFASNDGQVRVAMGGLRVAGHGDQHIYMTTANPSLLVPGAFCFNEAWQFLGMTVAGYAPGSVTELSTNAVAVLRTTALWDDLVGRADLGCGTAAQTLADIAMRPRRLRRPVSRQAVASA